MIARAVIGRVNDALKTQRLQLSILKDETEDGVEHFQPYGVSFVPPEGAEAIALAIGGARSHTVAICAQHPDKRPKGGEPDTGGLYTGTGDWRVFVDADGVVHVGAQAGAEFIALATKVLTELNDIRTRFDAFLTGDYKVHVHATAAVGAPSPPTVSATTAMGAATSVAATKAKAT